MEPARPVPRLRSVYSIAGLLLVGTVASLLAKIIYGVESTGRDGRFRPFRKPLFEVFSMFLGMSLCRLLEWIQPPEQLPPALLAQTTSSASADPLADVLVRLPSPWCELLLKAHHWLGALTPAATHVILVPAVLDAAATMLMCTGLLFAPVSVYQMLRGSMLVFCAIFSVTLLRRRLHLYNILGVALALGGITTVGLASVAGEEDLEARGALLVGILLMIAGQAMQALQVVAEEHLLQNLLLPPMQVVFYEGIYGVALCLCIIFPLAYILPGNDYGHRWEDTLDSLVMIAHSGVLVLILLSDATSMLLFNMFSMNVTQLSSALFRTMLETLRTFLVWMIDLWIYYRWSDGRFGEAWTRYSWLQVVGFLVVVAGTWLYSQHPVSIGPEPAPEMEHSRASTETTHALAKQMLPDEELERLLVDRDHVRYSTGETTAAPTSMSLSPEAGESVGEVAERESMQAREPRLLRERLRASPATSLYGTSPAFFMHHGGTIPAVYVGSPLPFATIGSQREARLRRNNLSRTASSASVSDEDSNAGP
jgi:drug/metabolite transporter (DMT)-like permease